MVMGVMGVMGVAMAAAVVMALTVTVLVLVLVLVPVLVPVLVLAVTTHRPHLLQEMRPYERKESVRSQELVPLNLAIHGGVPTLPQLGRVGGQGAR